MKLNIQSIEVIVNKVVEQWMSQNTVTLSVPKEQCIQYLVQSFVNELERETELHRDVEKILAQYQAQFESGELDRNKMFSMVKKQLAKEKNIIL